MMVERFDEETILRSETLIVEALRKLLETYNELRRRGKVTRDFLKKLCSLSVETRVWWILFEARGAQRFTDVFRVAGCSKTKLNDVLQKLLAEGLVRMVGTRYQAVLPPELVHFLD